jgi:hypothetical protein
VFEDPDDGYACARLVQGLWRNNGRGSPDHPAYDRPVDRPDGSRVTIVTRSDGTKFTINVTPTRSCGHWNGRIDLHEGEGTGGPTFDILTRLLEDAESLDELEANLDCRSVGVRRGITPPSATLPSLLGDQGNAGAAREGAPGTRGRTQLQDHRPSGQWLGRDDIRGRRGPASAEGMHL